MSYLIYSHAGNKHGIPFSVISKQGVEFESICKIIALHKERLDLTKAALKNSDIVFRQIASKQLTEIEYELQELWGFEQNFNLHRHWYHPGCNCSKMDNNDSFPHMIYISESCNIHKYLLDK